ncbi:uncharacterized protein LOC122813958 [Protopterus annectens]|uniref:uncharacterized protein LOC122813958 n=1 Tax=Protopterus annectens TaxID=7888 RepID=UPI001CF9C1A5|nr:uncharacterized protein LOC122813958 [Protopterus annectens]
MILFLLALVVNAVLSKCYSNAQPQFRTFLCHGVSIPCFVAYADNITVFLEDYITLRELFSDTFLPLMHEVGWALNLTKTVIFAGIAMPLASFQDLMVTTEGMHILGVPFGSEPFVNKECGGGVSQSLLTVNILVYFQALIGNTKHISCPLVVCVFYTFFSTTMVFSLIIDLFPFFWHCRLNPIKSGIVYAKVEKGGCNVKHPVLFLHLMFLYNVFVHLKSESSLVVTLLRATTGSFCEVCLKEKRIFMLHSPELYDVQLVIFRYRLFEMDTNMPRQLWYHQLLTDFHAIDAFATYTPFQAHGLKQRRSFLQQVPHWGDSLWRCSLDKVPLKGSTSFGSPQSKLCPRGCQEAETVEHFLFTCTRVTHF